MGGIVLPFFYGSILFCVIVSVVKMTKYGRAPLHLRFRYYQHLRWDDVPSRKGSAIERKVKEHLTRPINWSAPHVQSGKRWGEVIAEIKDL